MVDFKLKFHIDLKIHEPILQSNGLYTKKFEAKIIHGKPIKLEREDQVLTDDKFLKDACYAVNKQYSRIFADMNEIQKKSYDCTCNNKKCKAIWEEHVLKKKEEEEAKKAEEEAKKAELTEYSLIVDNILENIE